jgi:hypothetical protein
VDGAKVDLGTIHITVTPINDAPVADPDSYTVTSGETLEVHGSGVLVGDWDADRDPLTAVLVAGPAHGSLTLLPNGSLTYTPDGEFHGTDTFTYRAHDGSVGGNVATVTINVFAGAGPLVEPPPEDEPPIEEALPDEEIEVEEPEDPGTPEVPLEPIVESPADPPAESPPAPELASVDPTPVAPPATPFLADRFAYEFVTTSGNTSDSTGDPRESGGLVRAGDEPWSTEGAADSPDFSGPGELAHLGQPGSFWDDLDQLDKGVKSNLHFRNFVIGSAAATSMGLTVGYVAWAFRGGLLLTSLLAQLPAWKTLDPLVVLENVDEEDLRRRRQGGETLEAMIDKAEAAAAS